MLSLTAWILTDKDDKNSCIRSRSAEYVMVAQMIEGRYSAGKDENPDDHRGELHRLVTDVNQVVHRCDQKKTTDKRHNEPGYPVRDVKSLDACSNWPDEFRGRF